MGSPTSPPVAPAGPGSSGGAGPCGFFKSGPPPKLGVQEPSPVGAMPQSKSAGLGLFVPSQGAPLQSKSRMPAPGLPNEQAIPGLAKSAPQLDPAPMTATAKSSWSSA